MVGIGAVVVALGGLPTSDAATTQYLTGAVATGDVTDDVAATGTIATSASYGLSFGSPAHLAGATPAQRLDDVDRHRGQGRTPATRSRRARSSRPPTRPTSSASSPTRRPPSRPPRSASERQGEPVRRERRRRHRRRSARRRSASTTPETQLSTRAKTRDDLRRPRSSSRRSPRRSTASSPTVNVVTGLDAPTGDAIVIDCDDVPGHGRRRRERPRVDGGRPAGDRRRSARSTRSVTGTVTAIAPTAAGDTSGGVVSYAVTVSLTGRAADGPRRA